MKVILLEDIKGTGKKGDVLEASDGHARNYLLPRKLAVEATKTNLNELERQNKAKVQREAKLLEEAQAMAAKLEALSVSIKVRVGGGGKLFGSVTNKEVGEALKAQHGLDIDKKRISLPEPIKTAGEWHAQIKLQQNVTARLGIEISEG